MLRKTTKDFIKSERVKESRLIIKDPGVVLVPWVVLVPCSHMEVHPYSYFWWCGYF